MSAEITSGTEREHRRRTWSRTGLPIVVGLLSLIACLVPGGAAAALPKASSTLIEPGKSIGGVALGASPTSVTKAWGPGCAETSCTYSAASKTGQSPALALVGFEKTGSKFAAWEMSITVGSIISGAKPTPEFDTPLADFKTSKGIGLGSTATELKRAYHAAKKQIDTDNGIAIYTLKGKGEITTNFTVGTAGKITTISIQAHPGG
ncbi:MAG: hypothetical protein J0H06_00080 [Actinobacteria bacterium]|nr:hypothetical protein [Actinomycetota bacterium]